MTTLTLDDLRQVREMIRLLCQAWGPTHEQYHALDRLDAFVKRTETTDGAATIAMIVRRVNAEPFVMAYEDDE